MSYDQILLEPHLMRVNEPSLYRIGTHLHVRICDLCDSFQLPVLTPLLTNCPEPFCGHLAAGSCQQPQMDAVVCSGRISL